MSNEGFQGNGDAANMPMVGIIAQYIKDLSFENPDTLSPVNQPPQIDLGVDLQARRGDSDHYEVELKLRVNAKVENKTLFLVELNYAGLFRIANIPDEALQPILLVQAPHMLFPFARRIVADVVRDGGMPPLLIEPIDFAGLYQSKLAQGGITNPIASA